MKRVRRKPYTARGIRRKTCIRCGKPGFATWQVCSLNRAFVVLCKKCDVGLQAIVLRWARIPEWRSIVRRYAATIEGTMGYALNVTKKPKRNASNHR
jgi:hypothetical protein